MIQPEALDEDQTEFVLRLDDSVVAYVKGRTVGKIRGVWHGNARLGLVTPRTRVNEVPIVKRASGMPNLWFAMVNLKAESASQPRLPRQAIGTSEGELISKPIAIRLVVRITPRAVLPSWTLLRIDETKPMEICS